MVQRSSSKGYNEKERDVVLPDKNYKAILNEYCQKHYLPLPEYSTEYPESSLGYIAVVDVCGKQYRSTVQMAKKKAEQNAAGKAALDLGLVELETQDSGYKSERRARDVPVVDSKIMLNYNT